MEERERGFALFPLGRPLTRPTALTRSPSVHFTASFHGEGHDITNFYTLNIKAWSLMAFKSAFNAHFI